MPDNIYHSRGFTLIELMLVIVILGILATMSLPLLAAVRGDAKRTASDSTVLETQKAIDLYRLQQGHLPDLTSDWTPLTTRTTTDGKTFGPYLLSTPRNELVSSTDPSSVADSPTEVYLGEAAFAYDYQDGQGTGRLIAAMRNHP